MTASKRTQIAHHIAHKIAHNYFKTRTIFSNNSPRQSAHKSLTISLTKSQINHIYFTLLKKGAFLIILSIIYITIYTAYKHCNFYI